MDIALLALESLFYGVLIAAGSFAVALLRKYNLQEEVITLVAAAEMVFGEGEGKGKEKKEWVLDRLVKKFPFLSKNKLDTIIERFVYQVTNKRGQV